MDSEKKEKPRKELLSVKKVELQPETDFKLFFLMIFVLVLPATLTLLSVDEAITFKPSNINPTPLGYTWSLLLFIVPIVAIFIWIHIKNDEKYIKKSFWYAIMILVPLGFILDFLFGLTFFTFENHHATLQIYLYGFDFSQFSLVKKIPIEEFVFYITGFMAVLLIYIWCDEYWLEAYNIDYKIEAQNIDRIMVFHLRSILLGLILIVLAIIYKYLFPHPYKEGFPGYFTFLVLASIVPSAAFFRTTLLFINWRALAATFFFVLLVSLLWEATLAAPYQWWNYNYKQMLGITVKAWYNLPIEAVVVWLMVTFTTVIIYEVLKIWLNSKKKAKHAFLGIAEKDGKEQ
ncbi:MAG: hypothetical protein ACYSTS_00750 [Planctomycetota bacterium]|jgi:hypothetical protein